MILFSLVSRVFADVYVLVVSLSGSHLTIVYLHSNYLSLAIQTRKKTFA